MMRRPMAERHRRKTIFTSSFFSLFVTSCDPREVIGLAKVLTYAFVLVLLNINYCQGLALTQKEHTSSSFSSSEERLIIPFSPEGRLRESNKRHSPSGIETHHQEEHQKKNLVQLGSEKSNADERISPNFKFSSLKQEYHDVKFTTLSQQTKPDDDITYRSRRKRTSTPKTTKRRTKRQSNRSYKKSRERMPFTDHRRIVNGNLRLNNGLYEGLVVNIHDKIAQDDCRDVILGLQVSTAEIYRVK